MEQLALIGLGVVGIVLGILAILLILIYVLRRREQAEVLDPESVEEIRLNQSEGDALEARNTEFRSWDGSDPRPGGPKP